MEQKPIILHVFHWGLFASYSTCAVFYWEESTLCQQKINLTLSIILLLGIHRCLSLLRYFLQELSLDFEVLVVMLVVFVRNRESSEQCRDTQNQPFQNLSLYAFNFILITNSFYFCLLFFLLLVSYPMLYFCSRFFHTIQPNNFISPFTLALPQIIPETQLQRLVVPMDAAFKDEDCGICLCKLGESINNAPDPMRLICIDNQAIPEVSSPRNRSNLEDPKNDENITKNSDKNVPNNPENIQNNKISNQDIEQIENSYANLNKDTPNAPVLIADDRIVSLPNCLHKYHYVCVKEWFKYRATCPLCRRSIRRFLYVTNSEQEGPHEAAAAHD